MTPAVRMLLLGKQFKPWLLPGFLDQWDYRFGIGTDSSSNVNSWSSRRERAVVQTGSARPIKTGSGVSFDGISQYLELTDATTLSFLGGVPLSMFVVGNSDRASVQSLISARHSDGSIANKKYWDNDMSTATMRMNSVDTGNTTRVIGPADTSASITLLYGHRSSTEIAATRNGAPTAGATLVGTFGLYTTFSSLRFGANSAPAPSGFLRGNLQEFLIYGRILSDAERNAVFKYLSRKYGVSLI